MAFKINKSSTLSLDSPESLFRDVKTKKIAGALADQADLWREYQEKALDVADVALQLPTGGGKTLVGLVVAEWRRQKFGERTLFLCPTRQLVNQVVDQAVNTYGLKVHGFTGSKSGYDSEAIAEYQNCETVAVTTYSSLFNTSPFFDSPHVILVDDAHAAEQYIAGMWSMSIERSKDKHRPLYEALLAVLKPVLPSTDFHRLMDPDEASRDRTWVEKLPTPTLEALIPELVSVFDENAHAAELHFIWQTIRDHLDACQLYLGAGSLLIRPLLPPTSTHKPFSSAKQRIYMSATFGEAGDLERITGRPSILRLQAKASSDRQTVGRRYFLFPERSLSDSEQMELCSRAMALSGRTLVLTTDDKRAGQFRDFIIKNLGFTTFTAQDIEKSKNAFIGLANAVAVVSNRYDGIDFPEDECRLLIVEGLPRATNLQEQFLIRRMGAVDLLSVRITTRLVQAFGRCTRSDQDYSAVIVRGEELNKYLLTPERRKLLHPELHAELNFGIEQAKGTSIADYLDNLGTFLAQREDWRAANDDIISKRDLLEQLPPPGADELSKAAPIEIDYQSAMWGKDFERAFNLARSALGCLTDPRLRGYRALWHYLAGSAAWLAFKSGVTGFDVRAREQYSAALKTERAIAWLVPLSKLMDITDEANQVIADKNTWSIVERIESLFDRLGTLTHYKYTRFESDIRQKLEQNEARDFEDGHAKLGELLGYSTGNRNDTATPDPWWLTNESLCFIFEDHSDAKQPYGQLSVDKARQVCTHPNWVRDNLLVNQESNIVPILVTPVPTADNAALPHLKGVLLWPLDNFREWARNAMTVMREIRSSYPGSGDLAWRALAAEKLDAAFISPSKLLEKLKEQIAADLLKKK